jgi:hypothetical protein
MSHMTCQELHSHFENDLRVDISLPSASAEALEHIGQCPECNRFVEAQHDLATQLRLVRDSAPAMPASLDATVVANYQGYMSERSCLAGSVPVTRRIGPRTALGSAAAVAFAVILAYGGIVLFFVREQTLTGIDRQSLAWPPKAPQSQTTVNNGAAVAQKTTAKATKSPDHSVKRASDSVSVAERDDSLPAGFRSLMYCDQISCADDMEVIRVQLPSPVLGLTPASARTNDGVFADVLVGPDGIARGIRFVE